jgi:electron transfer flavoprotein beta subunit
MALKILVTVKRVEDPESKIRVKPDGSGIVTDGVNYKMNPFDEIAVEEGLRLKEKHGGEVIVATIGGEKSVAELRAALAMGADRALIVRHDGPLDPVVASAILKTLVEREQPDLVLLGKQSIDDDQNQTGQYLAERCGMPQATFASKTDSLESEAEQKRQPGLVLSADGKKLAVTREIDGGVETLELSLPAVVTTDLRLNKPRFASLPGIMKAKKKEVKELPAAELGLGSEELAPRVVVKRLSEPPKRKGGVRVADVAELWAKLHDEAKVL